ncbi:hypothetical protein LMV59_000950 [Listeria monocytogenes]|nr:hypothetical protein [Listeria monocytogenes]EIM2036995.1 hypothetical protein [Listeria monocytogenes]EIM2365043.1 hypothetical protein [Listeria monocytogenes]EIY8215684.1 hypothetical protein [Listeria monocytogenes]
MATKEIQSDEIRFVKVPVEEKAIFKLEISLRFRKPTLLRNAETGHAPFKAIT